jgi:hypothetical protein
MAIHDNKFDAHDRMSISYEDFVTQILNSEECKESAPEFYEFPEMFMDLNGIEIGDLQLKEDQSIFDFVYQNRKILESPEASRNLNAWVDLIWGVSQRSGIHSYIPYVYHEVWNNPECSREVAAAMLENLGSLPPQIFKDHVPPRGPFTNAGSITKLLQIALPKTHNIQNAFVFEKEEIQLILLFDGGTVQRFSIKMDRLEVESVYLAPLKLALSQGSIYVFDTRMVFALDWKRDRIHSIGYEQFKTFSVETNSVDFAIPGEFVGQVLIGSETGQIQKWPKQPNEPVFSVSSDRITAAAFNRNYGVFICATADGFLRFFQRWELTRAVPLKCVADRVMTTDGWNFVLINAQNTLMLFTLNGFLIKSSQIEFEI